MQKGTNKKTGRELAKMEISFEKFERLVTTKRCFLDYTDVINYDSFKDKETDLIELYVFTKKVPNKIRCDIYGVGDKIDKSIDKSYSNPFTLRQSTIWFKPKNSILQAVKERVRELSKLIPITFESVKVGECLFELNYTDITVWKIVNKQFNNLGGISIILETIDEYMDKKYISIPKVDINNSRRFINKDTNNLIATTPNEIYKFVNNGLMKSIRDSYEYLKQKRYYQLED